MNQAIATEVKPEAYGKVGVLFGGRSAERDISLMSGSGVLQALQSQGVEAHAFDPAQRSLADLAAGRPVAWVAMEGPGVADEVARATAAPAAHITERSWDVSLLSVTLLRGDQAVHHHLGDVHHHGRTMDWQIDGAPDPFWALG